MKNIYIETYGCQMNLADTEIVKSILSRSGFGFVEDPGSADLILFNTCSVRDNAESRIYKRLENLKKYKKINKNLVFGALGCMAERLKEELTNCGISLVVGPDEYKRLPELIGGLDENSRGVAVNLSAIETYNDISPLRKDDYFAWLPIMRGCNNFCSYCIVPYVRGRERSRSAEPVLSEIAFLRDGGFKEITLLGQNVNSYFCRESSIGFADLLNRAAGLAPGMRFRFVTSHPRDFSDELIETIAAHENICKHIHLPVQSGSDNMLNKMNRRYSVEHYLGLVSKIRSKLPDAAITTDIIAGFCGESSEDHLATLRLMEQVRFDGAFMFRYSPRDGTKAYDYADDVPEVEKIRRLNEIISLQQRISRGINKAETGKIHRALVESPSKRNPAEWQGRSDTNKVVIFQNDRQIKRGQLVRLEIIRSTAATLFGKLCD